MKTEITYTTDCELMIVDTLGGQWIMPVHFNDLKSALKMAEDIFNGLSIWSPKNIKRICITDTNTGEVLAKCFVDDTDPCEEDEEAESSKIDSYDMIADCDLYR